MNLPNSCGAWVAALLLALALTSTGCNRAYTRIPGASLNFPPTKTQHQAAKRLPYNLVVALPVDVRSQHYGEEIAKSDWFAVPTDAMIRSIPKLIQERLVLELGASGLFASVRTGPAGPNDVVLKTDIHAFCANSRGFLWMRIVGMTSLQVSLEKGGRKLLDQKFERAVTDADEEYSGANTGMIEHLMKIVMSDSLRETMRDILRVIETKL